MSAEASKVDTANKLLTGVLAVCSMLISVIFYTAKDDFHEMRKDINQIKLDIQQVKDQGGTHADAINKLDRQYDYLLKVKVDKRKLEP